MNYHIVNMLSLRLAPLIKNFHVSTNEKLLVDNTGYFHFNDSVVMNIQ